MVAETDSHAQAVCRSIAGTAGIIGTPMTDRTTDSEILQSFLAERDAPCPNCGYNLRSLTSDRCPECAEGLRLQVGLQEPRLAAYLAGLIGLASGAGFGGMLLIYAIYESLVDLPPNHVPVAMRVSVKSSPSCAASAAHRGGEEAGVQGQSPWWGFGGETPNAVVGGFTAHVAAKAAGVM